MYTKIEIDFLKSKFRNRFFKIGIRKINYSKSIFVHTLFRTHSLQQVSFRSHVRSVHSIKLENGVLEVEIEIDFFQMKIEINFQFTKEPLLTKTKLT